MTDETQIPVAFCEGCDEKVPVWVSSLTLTSEEDSSLEEEVLAVICPSCEIMISKDKDVEVEYFSIDELEKAIGWKAEYAEPNDV